jgi:hypothetical protein
MSHRLPKRGGKIVEINLIADRERIDQFDLVLLDN